MDMVRFPVRVKPGASRDAVGGAWDGPRGTALLVSVRAPAVDGKANEAVCRVLGEVLGVRRREVTVLGGHRSRDKLIELREPPSGVVELLEQLRRRPAEGAGKRH
jgi:uncharacterized protein (TIGR00251 family)